MIIIDREILHKFGSTTAIIWGHIKEQQELQGGGDDVDYTQSLVLKDLGINTISQVKALSKLEDGGYISKKTYGRPPHRHVILLKKII